jgi:bifunctional non-homologous end joining protein LigD
VIRRTPLARQHQLSLPGCSVVETSCVPFRTGAMLPSLVAPPFHRPGWVYEEKYDGYRILAYKEGERLQLLSRQGRDWTHDFNEVADAVRATRAQTLVLDGEVVVFDRQLVSRFDLLRRGDGALIYAVFDCLYRDWPGSPA